MSSQAAKPYSTAHRWYALVLLVVVYVFNFIDRSILGILVQPIKEDLQVSDTAMGFLGGIAFAIFYTVMGIPIARLADRYSRVNIISICLAIWSAMTAASGLANNFWQLFAARLGVGVGEAGLAVEVEDRDAPERLEAVVPDAADRQQLVAHRTPP